MICEKHDIIARAFALARSGQVRSVEQIRYALKREGFINWDVHFTGKLIRSQLRAAIKQARAPSSNRAASLLDPDGPDPR